MRWFIFDLAGEHNRFRIYIGKLPFTACTDAPASYYSPRWRLARTDERTQSPAPRDFSTLSSRARGGGLDIARLSRPLRRQLPGAEKYADL
jgi:hypothetical protein